MGNHKSILDQVEMSNGKEFPGVVDFISEKFIHFYNFEDIQENAHILLAVIEWRRQHPSMRFSVFCAIKHPGLSLPRLNLINRRGISKMEGCPESIINRKSRKSASCSEQPES